jgi:hypothetical protein
LLTLDVLHMLWWLLRLLQLLLLLLLTAAHSISNRLRRHAGA